MKLTYDYVDMQSFIENMSMKDRSCSMFLEPSHFAQYIIPFLAIELGRLHETKRIISPIAIFLTLVLLFLKSGNGLLLCALLWFISILFSNIRKSKKIFILFPFITIVLFYGFNYIIHTEMGEQLLSRMDELDPDSGKMTSGIMRVFRGFWVFGDLSSIIQIFGGSFGAKDMLIEGSSYIWMFRDNERYINNIQMLLISFGFIGLFFFFYFILKNSLKSFTSILLVSAFILLSFMESFPFTTKMLFYIGLILVYNEKNTCNCA